MTRIFAFAGLIFLSGCAATRTAAPDLAPVQAEPSATNQLAFLGGDGSSVESAVLIRGAHGEVEGVKAENIWIHAHCWSCKKQNQSLISKNGRLYDLIGVVDSESGRSIDFYFDITEFFGRF